MLAPSLFRAALLFLCPLLVSLVSSLPVPNVASQTHDASVALLHMYDSVSFFQRLGALTGENKARYAKRHGYDMIFSTPHRTTGILKLVSCGSTDVKILRGPDENRECWAEDESFDIDHARAPTFGKIKLTLAACRGRKNAWMLWSDADAMVINQTVPLETIIDDGYDIMFAYDWLMLNAGVILFKCSDWTISFLHKVYDARRFDTARALDQSSFQSHFDNLTKAELNLHVKVVPKYAINVYTEEYRPGDFLLHMAGKLYEATEPGIFAIANQYDVLSMQEDVEDIKAFFRGRRFLNYYSGTCNMMRGGRQAGCKSEDERRILLNESLGSMSMPNRYRHVGLRYYWLGNWKDKYDVPGWDKKRKELPIRAHQRVRPNIPPAAFQEVPADDKSGDTKHSANHKHNDHASVNGPDHPVDEIHGVDKETKKDTDEKDEGKDDTNDDDDDDDGDDNGESGMTLFAQILIFATFSAVIAGSVLFLRKKQAKMSKSL